MVRKHINIFTAKAVTGIGTVLDVEAYDRILLAFSTDGGGTAALTAKVQGSIQQAIPDFSAAASKTNQWSYVGCVDISSGSGVQGNTGFIVATADNYVIYEVNVSALKYLTVNVTARSAGSLNVDAWLLRMTP